ncbi:amino acid synthesis family protein [Bosea sp. (in: a-proteobacteria)]|jgi:hypothetical protein|uniref:amino acid synthesis family protein n=1 Tax=Bosea sp. (in: a-proteobacteria) TaxID=1871050 RepID=UPI002DDD82BA|nr:amino acid synthesis family protein [Bosea sp. (in: a-proteobacteria)]HEV2508434.1 amino acid synthesis family protein [Bosea sp. (in: a-proteobacteria)]
MQLNIRRTLVLVEDRHEDSGVKAEISRRKVAIVAIVENPLAGKGYVADLKPLIEASIPVGARMGELAVEALGGREVQSYGKGGIVGLNGEQEHANALLTTAFANPIRDAIGGARAWISSVTKIGAPGTPIDVPMNHKHDVYVRSHYDSMALTLPDTPMPDEVALIFCLSSEGRLNARVGGLTHAEVMSRESGV